MDRSGNVNKENDETSHNLNYRKIVKDRERGDTKTLKGFWRERGKSPEGFWEELVRPDCTVV